MRGRPDPTAPISPRGDRPTESGRQRLCLAAVVVLAVAWAGVDSAARPSVADEPSTASSPGVPSPEQAARIEALIGDLGAEDFLVRQAAQADLIRLGPVAFDAVHEARNSVDLEVASRAKFILRALRMAWTTRGDAPEVRRVMRDYDRLATEDRRGRIDRLGQLPLGQSLPVLVRLARYEPDEILSKLASLQVLAATADREEQTPRPSFERPWPVDVAFPDRGANPWAKTLRPVAKPDDAVDAARADRPTDTQIIATIREELVAQGGVLARIDRPAAQWLIAEAATLEDPREMPAVWLPLVRQEVKTCYRAVKDCSPEVLRRLLRPMAERMAKAGFDEPAEEVAALAIDQCEPVVGPIHELAQWAIQSGLPDLVETLAVRFPRQFDETAVLVFDRAEAARLRGDEEAAARYAREASALIEDPRMRSLIAQDLENRGRIDWAIDEYRLALKADGETPSASGLFALRALAALLHDQDRDEEAADLLDGTLELAKSHPARWQQLLENISGSFEALTRYHLYAAKAALSRGDRDRAFAELRAGLKEDEPDIDLIILAFRTFDRGSSDWPALERVLAAEKAKWQAQIEQGFNDVEPLPPSQQPDRATEHRYPLALNQFAWLVANTEGDLEFACRCSHRSLDFDGEDAGRIDTLGRCYYALGLYDTAVMYQRYALSLDPTKGEMQRQLELFEQAAADAKK